LTLPLNIGVPKKHHELIWIYYLSRTNIRHAIEAMIKSIIITDQVVALTAKEDRDLIDRIMETANTAFPTAKSTINNDIPYNAQVANIIHRMFGYDVQYTTFPRSKTFNANFHSLQDAIFLNISKGVWWTKNQLINQADAGALYELLINMQELLQGRDNNTVTDISNAFTIAYMSMVDLIRDRKLIRDRLNIQQVGDGLILRALGAKFNIQVPANAQYLFDIAYLAKTFYNSVQKTDWTIDKAASLYTNSDWFKQYFMTHKMVWGVDYSAMAVQSVGFSTQPQINQRPQVNMQPSGRVSLP